MTSTKKRGEKALSPEPPKWGCFVKDCKVDTRKTICPHIERALPQIGDGRVNYVAAEAISQASIDFLKILNPTWDRSRFLELLRNYGITEGWDLDLLEARYFDRHTFRRIKELFNYTDHRAVMRRLRYLQNLLLERGFAQEME